AAASPEWQGLRTAYENARHRFVAVDGQYLARNMGHSYTASFDGRGFSVAPDGGGWHWGLKFVSYGWGEASRGVCASPVMAAEGSMLTYAWDEYVDEWFRNESTGLEHGFTIHDRVAGSSGPLTLQIAVKGGLAATLLNSGRDVRFADSGGNALLTYNGLVVVDAAGRDLEARWALAGPATLELRVADDGACYPVTVDPVIQQAYLKASNTGEEDWFGAAVAASGDTVIIGAPKEDSAATGVDGNQADDTAPDAGAAYVFVYD